MTKTVPLALISILIATSSPGQARPPGRTAESDSLARRGPVASSDDEGAVVKVDCDAGGRIADALREPARQLAIEIRGICEENVEIRRDNVTLIGTDPTLDGIRESGKAPVLRVRRATHVRIRNLRIEGPSGGVLVSESSDGVRLENCDLPNTAVKVTQTSRVAAEQASLDSAFVDLGARLECRRCTMAGASATDDGIVVLRDSVLAHPFGFGAVIGALRGTVVAESSRMLGYIGSEDSSISLENSRVSLWLTLQGTSHLELRGSSNEIDDEIEVGGFSTVWIEPGSSFSGTIRCYQAGNVSCDDVSLEGTVEGCSLCDPGTAP